MRQVCVVTRSGPTIISLLFLLYLFRLRDEEMPELGIRLEDDGARPWTAVPSDILKKEIADKKRLADKGR